MAKHANRKKEHAVFLQPIVLKSSSNLKRRDIICVWTLRNIEQREKLFVDFASYTSFFLHAKLEQSRCHQMKKVINIMPNSLGEMVCKK